MLYRNFPHEQTVISLISMVPKKNGKHHLIINMRLLNFYLCPPKFKFNGLCDLAPLLQKGDYLFTIDFNNRFHHVEVHPHHQPLLGIQWRGKHYTY
jgi:hypothetical protein